MHEFVYADRILQTVLDQMKTERREHVRKVRVEVGEFLNLSDESLNMAYGILVRGTKADGSRLSVKLLRGVVACETCGFSGKVAPSGGHEVDPVVACPKCGAPLRIESGNQVRIIKIE